MQGLGDSSSSAIRTVALLPARNLPSGSLAFRGSRFRVLVSADGTPARNMKLLLLLLLLPLSVLGDDLEFDGVLVIGGITSVSLLNQTTGRVDWVPVGGRFDGYTVTALTYDEKLGDVVVLTKLGGSLTTRLSLKNSTIVAAAPAPALSAAQQKAVTNNLRQLSAGADQYMLEHGVTSVTFDQLVGTTPDKYIKPFASVSGENYSGLVIKQGQPVKVTMPDGTALSYGP